MPAAEASSTADWSTPLVNDGLRRVRHGWENNP
jgi:hypothetical protein